ncbi:MAG TPA: ABC transporter permease, partial [Sporosarcina psychrophila]|nr:ABC transporter permease [Sporosarcina psychrophila]
MKINSIWTERARDFYIDIAKYFSIIAMSVLYSFIIFGSVFIYYYLKFLQWLPPYFQTESIASFVITLTLLKTSVRTFLKKADIIFLMPAEKKLSSYFRTSM